MQAHVVDPVPQGKKQSETVVEYYSAILSSSFTATLDSGGDWARGAVHRTLSYRLLVVKVRF